ncbi:MAG: type II toxin-antitoxin system VapC family toxin [Candidatus Amoebophilus sp.]
MEQRYLIDSNVLIDYAASRLPEEGISFIEHIFNTDFLISVITKIEVLGFNEIPAKMKSMEDFVSTATVLPLDELVTSRVISLRREYKIKLGDAIIAATALTYDLTLITRNTVDFNNIKGVQVIDPHINGIF